MQCPHCNTPTWPVETIVPGLVRAYRRDEWLRTDPRNPTGKLYPSHAFALGSDDTKVESTFVKGSNRVLSFVCRNAANLVNSSGVGAGLLEVGGLELLVTSDTISASYDTGERDVRPRLFELCGQEGCGGVIAPSTKGRPGFCMLEPAHDLSHRRIVRMAARLETIGVRLTGLPVVPDAHSLAHGLRAGLEQVAGVLVRSIGEHVAEDAIYLYDMETGGAGVCELLLDPANQYLNFRTATEVARDLVTCSCEDGCPRCLYQFGCATRNAPSTLSRLRLQGLLAEELVPRRVNEVSTEHF